MSDNVVRPDWANNGSQGGDGGGPTDSRLEQKVSSLEIDVKKIAESVHKTEIATARIEAALGGRVDALMERLRVQGDALSRLDSTVRDLASKVDSKLPGMWQIVAIFASLLGLLGAAIALAQKLGVLH